MEIRNNTMNSTSFGMAFIKPASAGMSKFTEYVTNVRQPRFVKRGLKQFQRQQAKNRHFDVVYDPKTNRIFVRPTSPKAKESYKEAFFEEGHPYKSNISYYLHKEDLLSRKKGILNKFKMVGNLLALARYALTHPAEYLPGNLCAAGRLATEQANKIETTIANERKIDKILK